MKGEYYFWSVDASTKYVTVLEPQISGIPEKLLKKFYSKKTEPILDEFPKNITFMVNEEFPKKAVLADNLYNFMYLTIISPLLKEFIEAKAYPNVEFLPVKIIHQKDEFPYFILHNLGLESCMDHEKWMAVTQRGLDNLQENGPGIGTFATTIPLNGDQLKNKPDLFRIDGNPIIMVIRKSLVEELAGKGFTGLSFIPVEEFEFMISSPNIIEGVIRKGLIEGLVEGKKCLTQTE